MLIRCAHLDDAVTIGDITVAAYQDGGHLSADSPYEVTLRDVGPRVDFTVVAEVDSDVAGAATITPNTHQLTGIALEDEWEIRFVAVCQSLWGTGVGRALIEACEQRAHDAGATAVVLRVIDINERGLGFYDRLGYVRTPERDWSPETDPSIRLLAFRKVLPAAI